MRADDITLGNGIEWGDKRAKVDMYRLPIFKDLAEEELLGNEMGRRHSEM